MERVLTFCYYTQIVSKYKNNESGLASFLFGVRDFGIEKICVVRCSLLLFVPPFAFALRVPSAATTQRFDKERRFSR